MVTPSKSEIIKESNEMKAILKEEEEEEEFGRELCFFVSVPVQCDVLL